MLYSADLRIRIDDTILTWGAAAPVLISLLAFGAPLQTVPPPPPSKGEHIAVQKRRKEKRRSFPSWFFGGWAETGGDKWLPPLLPPPLSLSPTTPCSTR